MPALKRSGSSSVRRISSVFLFVFCTGLALPGAGTAAGKSSLPRSTPEQQGVSSAAIESFLKAATASNLGYHSFMIVRHGSVIAEGAWAPYTLGLRNTLYSVSKSFTSTAVGLAESEHRLDIEQPVLSFFPEEKPDSVPANLAALKVRDLLMMAAGQDPEPTFEVLAHESNWVRGFFAHPIVKQPGGTFLYNSLATYMLSAIVQKATGEKVIDYLTPRLFAPLGITGADWESDTRGINTGGWGLRLSTEDMGKFGQLLLAKGEWKGRQIVPKAWVEEATSFKIDQKPGADRKARLTSEWAQGYCYQFWRCRYNAFRADGAYGQYIIVMPDQDAVVVLTAETYDMQAEINLVWEYLLPALERSPLPEDPKAVASLKRRIGCLALPRPAGEPEPALAGTLAGKVFIAAANAVHIDSLGFDVAKGVCRFTFRQDNRRETMAFGHGNWLTGASRLSGPALLRNVMQHGVDEDPWKFAGMYRWKDAKTLELTHHYLETPHSAITTCTFEGDHVEVVIHNSSKGTDQDVKISGISDR
jgi:CubicO group peptidase (beta-lactamase class C family)